MVARNSLHRARRKRLLPAAPVLLVGFAVAGLAGLVLFMELARTPQEPEPTPPPVTQVNDTTPATPTPAPSPTPSPTPSPSAATPEPSENAYIVPAGRSPLPQPGETFSRPIPAKRLASIELTTLKPTAPEPEPGEVVPWTEAKLHIGREITVGGRITDTHMHRSGELCFLNFQPYPSKAFYLVAFRPTFGAFPESPEKYFLNQYVHVTGKPVFHRDRVQIQIHDADQIKRVPAPTPPAEGDQDDAEQPDSA